MDELKQRLIDVWRGLEQSSGEEDIKHMSMLKDDTLSTACELTMLILFISVTFNVTCLTFTLFDYEIVLATALANTFLFILQGSALTQFCGLVVDFRVHLVVVNFCLQQ